MVHLWQVDNIYLILFLLRLNKLSHPRGNVALLLCKDYKKRHQKKKLMNKLYYIILYIYIYIDYKSKVRHLYTYLYTLEKQNQQNRLRVNQGTLYNEYIKYLNTKFIRKRMNRGAGWRFFSQNGTVFWRCLMKKYFLFLCSWKTSYQHEEQYISYFVKTKNFISTWMRKPSITKNRYKSFFQRDDFFSKIIHFIFPQSLFHSKSRLRQCHHLLKTWHNRKRKSFQRY